MKGLKIAVIIVAAIVVVAIAGYFLFNFLGFSFPWSKEKDITGNARLEVTLLLENGEPLVDIEVDVAEKPGPPPVGGIAATNSEGLAIFNINPGVYHIYFNDRTFPKNLQKPEVQQVEVVAGEVNETTIVLETK